jgi:DNA-binding transcriptional LysR family regulator
MLNEIDLARTDLNLLVLFEIVTQERHVGRSAQRLNLSPSAVSHGLGRLRALFGDPLFLKTPRGVVPTARAAELSAPVAEVLAHARAVISTVKPFDPARSSRRFIIGAPDGVSAVILPPLLDAMREASPHVNLGIRQLLPRAAEPSPQRAWRDALVQLDERAMDVAILPVDEVPARFVRRTMYEEDFVIAMRDGHPYARDPGLRRYCAMQHLIVSHTGDAQGFVDAALAQQGLSRHVALTVPNFMFALAVLAGTELVSALPRSFVAAHGPRFGIVAVEAPIALRRFQLGIVVPRVAMMDAGLAWLVARLEQAAHAIPRVERPGPGLERPRKDAKRRPARTRRAGAASVR